jgi:hypothetical protein
MLIANSEGQQVAAWRVKAGDGYTCPECEEEVFLKPGVVIIPHFSHYPESSCGYGSGESERHMLMKVHVMDALQAVPDVRYEAAVIPGRRADLALEKQKIAVECQSSRMTEEEWEARTRAYSTRGRNVMWLWDSKFFGYVDATAGPVPPVIRACSKYSYGHLNVCDPYEKEFYEVRLTYKGSRSMRRFAWKPVETGGLNPRYHKESGLRTVSLLKDRWWSHERKRA